MDLPKEIEIDAWTGCGVARSEPGTEIVRIAKAKAGFGAKFLLPGQPVDERKWEHPDVGWGLVLPENPDLEKKDRATAVDAPAPIQALLDARAGAPVFRYDATWEHRHTKLRRYFPDGTAQDPAIVGSAAGVAKGRVPRYLLIYGSPRDIPWDFQLTLNATHFVGRLDLEGDALSNYVDALLSGWAHAPTDPFAQVVWGVDNQTGDITRLMRDGIARPLERKYAGDADLSPTWFETDGATTAKLIEALEASKPGLVITTSHGVTTPLGDLLALGNALGLPVGVDDVAIDPAALVAAWPPAGAIWYARACCSAGADAETGYDGLVKAGGSVDRVLRGVARLGAVTSPLPRALLGAKNPLRAFVGHVEPTFDWTIRDPRTKQLLTTSVIDAFYQRLFSGSPIGHALEKVHIEGSQLIHLYEKAMRAFNAGEDTLGTALATKLVARDHERVVILGDPTVALPLPQ